MASKNYRILNSSEGDCSSSSTDSDGPTKRKRQLRRKSNKETTKSSVAKATQFSSETGFFSAAGYSSAAGFSHAPAVSSAKNGVSSLPGFSSANGVSSTTRFSSAAGLSTTTETNKKSNNVWVNVLNEQILSEVAAGVTGVAVEHGHGLEHRGCETYITRLMRKRKRDDDDIKSVPVNNDSSELSSGGLSDNSKKYWRERKQFRKSKKVECAPKMKESYPFATSSKAKTNEPSAMEIEVPDTSSTKGPDVSKTAQNLGTEQNQPKKKGTYMRPKMMAMDDEQLGHFLANRMKENNRTLMVRAVNLLGKEVCIQLYFKMLKIETGGGLLIKSKARRRTRGGVFLYLVKNDKRLSAEKVTLLFQEEQNRRINDLKSVEEKNQKDSLAKDGMDDFEIRIHKRMQASESIGMQETRKANEARVKCDIDNDEVFSYSIDKLVHNKKGFIPQEGPVGNRQTIVYDDLDLF